MNGKTCCFTGHRHISEKFYSKIEAVTKFYIEFLIKEGVDFLIAGGAVGYNFLCASTVLELKKKYPLYKA